MRIFISSIAVLLMATFASAAEDYYVWVDENGVTNYSERSPQGYSAQHISSEHRFGERIPQPEDQPSRGSRPGAAPPEPEGAPAAAPAPSSNVDPDALAGPERAAIAAKISETKKKNCEIGKRNLAQLQSYSRIRVKDDDGKERFLSDEEHKEKIEGARQIIKENCTG